MDFIEQAILEGVALDDLGLDIDEMADLDGFFEWLTYDPMVDKAVWNEEEGYWEYPDNEDDPYWDEEQQCWVYPEEDEDD